jgi:hypothetical protein
MTKRYVFVISHKRLLLMLNVKVTAWCGSLTSGNDIRSASNDNFIQILNIA